MQKHLAVAAAALSIVSIAGTARAQTPRPSTPAALSVQGPSAINAPAGLPMAPATWAPVGGVPPYSGTASCATSLPEGVIIQTDNGSPPTTMFGVWPSPGTDTCSGSVTDSTGATAGFKVTITVAYPKPGDVVGVGSNTTQTVMDQFSANYNSARKASAPHLYGFDATNLVTGGTGDPIITKQGCAAVARPNGSSAGISRLTTGNGTTSGHPCIDFARSSEPRQSADPSSVSFLNLAGDAVTYSTAKTTKAPANLTTAQLAAIYNCTDTNWSQVGGKSAPIVAVLPQSGSGTGAFFLQQLGLTSPGACVVDGVDPGTTTPIEENEGINPIFTGGVAGVSPADVVFPFSVGSWLSQTYHSATCVNTGCTPDAQDAFCYPTGNQNKFGCDEAGTLVLKKVNGTAPTSPFPPTSKSVVNTGFTPTFQRLLYDVVVAPKGTQPGPSTPDGVALESIFGPKGWACTNATAHKELLDYGFQPLPAGSAAGDCGFAS